MHLWISLGNQRNRRMHVWIPSRPRITPELKCSNGTRYCLPRPRNEAQWKPPFRRVSSKDPSIFPPWDPLPRPRITPELKCSNGTLYCLPRPRNDAQRIAPFRRGSSTGAACRATLSIAPCFYKPQTQERSRGEPARSLKDPERRVGCVLTTITPGGLFPLHAAGFFPRNPAVPGVRKSRPRLRPARLSGSARRGMPAAGAVSGTPRRGIPFRAFQKSGFSRGFQG